MKYTAINIGPIVSTLGMARKPRELWAASFLFSHLMKCIIEKLPTDKIISPAIFAANEKNGVGLYPDRVFVKKEIQYETIKPAIDSFASNLHLNADYFNVMLVSDNYETDSAAIKDLNQKLDCMELFNRSINANATNCIGELIRKKYDSKLFDYAFEKGKFKISTLAEIASVELKNVNEVNWKNAKRYEKEMDETGNLIPEDLRIVEEGSFYQYLKEKFGKDVKSYHKYICVVQADGDNVGKTVSHQKLSEGKVNEISKALLQFGKNAKTAIDGFGGLPIYAGGDDLLFIAPVVGKDGTSILKLLDKLNDESFKCVADKVAECNLSKDGKPIKASLSFGVSISYYKYPLYEALENARHLLFDVAKKVDGKNAVAVDWRKHSGAGFGFSFSGNNADLKKAFDELIKVSGVEESVVSAVSHKIRECEGLLGLWITALDFKARNLNFFKAYLDYNPDKADKDKNALQNSQADGRVDVNFENLYKDAAMNLLNEISKINTDGVLNAVKTLYGMLRIAKFIKGEEVIDE